MNDTVRFWLENLYKDEIEEVRGTIRSEQLWELGYSGEEPNPHTENIKMLREYIEVLEEKINEV